MAFPNSSFSSIFSSNVTTNFLPDYDIIPSRAVNVMNSIPRGGYSNDIELLLSSNPTDQKNYIFGAIFISVILFLCFTCWALLLLIMKCKGCNGIEYFSESTFQDGIEYPFHHENEIMKRKKRMGIVFLFLCLLLVGFNILLTSLGFKNMFVMTHSMEQVTQSSLYMIEEASDLINSLSPIRQSLDEVLLEMKNETSFESICPGEDLTSLIDTSSAINLNDALVQLNDINAQLLLVENYKPLLSDARDTVVDVDEAIHTFNTKWNWKLLIFTIPYVLCAGFFTVGVILSWNKSSFTNLQFFLSYLVSPFFICLVVISSILVCCLGVLAIIDADACTNPQTTIETIMNHFLKDTSSFAYVVLFYILDGCNLENANPLLIADEYQAQLEEAITFLNQFIAVTNSIGMVSLNDMCQKDVTSKVYSLKKLQTSFQALRQLAMQIISLFSCPRLYQFYAKTIEQTMCEYSTRTLGYIYFILIFITLCGWIIITLRSSWVLHFKEKI
jgi:hypothetical protein